MWYGVTTAVENDNLMYILSGLELRHAAYLESELRLLGLAGSRRRGREDCFKSCAGRGIIKVIYLNMKQYLETI